MFIGGASFAPLPQARPLSTVASVPAFKYHLTPTGHIEAIGDVLFKFAVTQAFSQLLRTQPGDYSDPGAHTGPLSS